MVGLQTLDLAIGVRVPASQPNRFKHLRAALKTESPVLCAYSMPARKSWLHFVPVFENSIRANLSEAPCCMSGQGRAVSIHSES